MFTICSDVRSMSFECLSISLGVCSIPLITTSVLLHADFRVILPIAFDFSCMLSCFYFSSVPCISFDACPCIPLHVLAISLASSLHDLTCSFPNVFFRYSLIPSMFKDSIRFLRVRLPFPLIVCSCPFVKMLSVLAPATTIQV